MNMAEHIKNVCISRTKLIQEYNPIKNHLRIIVNNYLCIQIKYIYVCMCVCIYTRTHIPM